jgi:hypothetical protein
LLPDPSTRVWMDRLISYYLETGNGQQINRIHDAIAAIEELSAFLDSVVGGRRLGCGEIEGWRNYVIPQFALGAQPSSRLNSLMPTDIESSLIRTAMGQTSTGPTPAESGPLTAVSQTVRTAPDGAVLTGPR